VLTSYWPEEEGIKNPETIVSISTKSFVVRSWNDIKPDEDKPYQINWIAIADEEIPFLTEAGDLLMKSKHPEIGRTSKQFVSTFSTTMQHGWATMVKQNITIKIPFLQPFANIPTVVISQRSYNKDQKPINGHIILTITDVSTSEFTVSSCNGTNVDYDISWIAYAKPGDTHVEADV